MIRNKYINNVHNFFLQFMTESHILWPKHLNAPQVWVSFEHYQQFGFTLVKIDICLHQMAWELKSITLLMTFKLTRPRGLECDPET